MNIVAKCENGVAGEALATPLWGQPYRIATFHDQRQSVTDRRHLLA